MNCSSCENWRCSSLSCDSHDCCENHDVSEIGVTLHLDVRVEFCVVPERQQHSRRDCDRYPRPRSWGADRPCGRASDLVRTGACVSAYDPLWKPWQARRLSGRWLLERRAAVLQAARRSRHQAVRRVETCEASVSRFAHARHRRNRARHRAPGVPSSRPFLPLVWLLVGLPLSFARKKAGTWAEAGSLLLGMLVRSWVKWAQQSLRPY